MTRLGAACAVAKAMDWQGFLNKARSKRLDKLSKTRKNLSWRLDEK
jgi:hypothetical protein